METVQRGEGRHTGSRALHPKERIVAVQLLRGIAASLVVAYHLIERYQRRGALRTDLPPWMDRIGEVGVLVFFVISGFIMVYTTLEAGRAISAGAFLRNRFTRIAPFYYLTTVLIVGFRLATEGLSTKAFLWPRPWEWVASLLFIPYRNAEGALQPIYKLGWTLNYEMAFYLLFAGGLLLARRKAGVVVCLALLAIVGVGTMLPEPRANGVVLSAYFLTRPILLYFAIGMALGLAFLRVRGDRPRCHPYLVALAACAAIAQALLWPAGWSMLWVGVAVAVATLLDAPMERTPRFARLCTAFGNASFAIYLTHSFVLGAYAAVTVKLHPASPAAWVMLVLGACLLCFAVGWAAWQWIEKPMTRRLRQGRGLRRVAPTG